MVVPLVELVPARDSEVEGECDLVAYVSV